MDSYLAFLIGVLVGQWILLFALWRAVVKLIHLLDSLERNPSISPASQSPLLLNDNKPGNEGRGRIY